MKKKCLLGFMVVMFTLATWIGVSFAESSQFSIRKKCVNGWENGKTYTFNGKVSKKITLNAYYDYSEKPASYAWENRADYITVSVYKKTKNWLGITKWTKVKDVFFNGSKLWIHMSRLNETFYHYTEPSPWFSKLSTLTNWFDPKKIFVNMTRGTLKALFEISAVKSEKQSDGDFQYTLKLTPKMKEIFKSIFEIGYYEATFSEKTYLPIKVIEYDTNNKEKTRLSVNSHKINNEVADELFEYKNTTKAVMMPITVVIMQKIEDYRDKAIEKMNKAAESMKSRFLNWSL